MDLFVGVGFLFYLKQMDLRKFCSRIKSLIRSGLSEFQRISKRARIPDCSRREQTQVSIKLVCDWLLGMRSYVKDQSPVTT